MDDIQFSIGNRQHEIMMSDGVIEWGGWNRDSGLFWGWSATPVTPDFWRFSPAAWDGLYDEPHISFEKWRTSCSTISTPFAITAIAMIL
ncbi:MAG: hypothetical protein JWP89_3632 [Schlesneria sp.]|nr:hypothetical protein [Schlesneria sp.]